MKELIEKLKDNKVGWVFLSEEEQECMRQANKKGKIENLLFSGEWEGHSIGFAMTNIGAHEIFRIKHDYQPEPEYVDVEVKKHTYNGRDTWLGIFDDDCPFVLPHYFIHIHCLPSMPNFKGFKFENDSATATLVLTNIANYISEGNKVYARFRSP